MAIICRVSPPVFTAAFATRSLLAGAIDYAGLFPPADLDMPVAVANYLGYRASPEAWALGRFVVPVGRLSELEDSLLRSRVRGDSPIPLSAVIGTGTADDMDAIEKFDARSREHGARVGTVEVKAASAGVVRAVLAGIPPGWTRYLEVPSGEGAEAALDAVASGGAYLKLRAGGITAEAFPSADQLLALLVGAARRRIPFKATAGMHHPLRGQYRLTYAEGAATGTMTGYLNIMLAAAVLHGGGDPALARSALLEEDPAALHLDDGAVRWRAERFGGAEIAAMRAEFCHSFGSCSFREPMDELSLEVGR